MENMAEETIKFLREELDRVTKERDEARATERSIHAAFAGAAGAAQRLYGMCEVVQASLNADNSIDAEHFNDQINEVAKQLAAAYQQAGVAIE
jgi:hypothetical protein